MSPSAGNPNVDRDPIPLALKNVVATGSYGREKKMRRVLVSLGFVIVVGFAAPSAAFAMGNPNTGQPNQSCQTELTNGGTTPGQAASSPGSPFNEPGFGSTNGGTGGAAYSAGNAHSPNTTNAVSQYDVACFQVSSH
jgi:hypothetical protein